jgi:hypothetical protein
MPDELTRWTAWLAMAGLAASAAARLCGMPDQSAKDQTARWFWTLGCVILWIHVACAFEFQHHWSHADAYAHTARKTAEFTGLDWGGGLYFNYLLMLVWAADAVWWWIGLPSYQDRPAVVSAVIIGFVGFMAFNATIVFGSGLLRWLAAATALILGLCAIRRRKGGKSP